MKLLPTLLSAALGCTSLSAEQHGMPYYSVGDLTMDSSGAGDLGVLSPDIEWQIQHPSLVSSYVTFDPATGALTTKSDLRVTMHIVGIGAENYLHRSKVGFWATENSGAWNLLFEGTPLDLKAHVAVYDKTLSAGTSLLLAGRRLGEDGRWLPSRSSTGDAGTFVRGLRKDDPVPTTIANAPMPAMAGYLSTESGSSTVQVGPTQLLFCFELNAFAEDETKHDLQDLLVLVTFETL